MRGKARGSGPNSSPAEPWELMLAFIMPFLVLPILIYSFVIERLVIGDPAWLPITAGDLAISFFLFGSFDQDLYGAFMLVLFGAGLGVGSLTAYVLFRPFLNRMARGETISKRALTPRFVLDWFFSYPVAVLLISLLAWMAGAVDPIGLGEWGFAPLPAFALWAGYLTGSSIFKGSLGLWWRYKLSAPAGETSSSKEVESEG